ncbi:hypothetical protein M271_26675 [Streptomyces rapamycinicus NRRL 5491]|nr:hypothetical protein M271_26675 [Streptomyces rapamycinicus NRRL 5491]
MWSATEQESARNDKGAPLRREAEAGRCIHGASSTMSRVRASTRSTASRRLYPLFGCRFVLDRDELLLDGVETLFKARAGWRTLPVVGHPALQRVRP